MAIVDVSEIKDFSSEYSKEKNILRNTLEHIVPGTVAVDKLSETRYKVSFEVKK